MFRNPRAILVVFIVILVLASSCGSSSGCSVKLNKKKAKYYNSVQFGGGRKR